MPSPRYATPAVAAVVFLIGCGGGSGHHGTGAQVTPSPSAPTPTSTAALATPTNVSPTSTPVSGAHRTFAVGALAFTADGGASVVRSETIGGSYERVFSTDTFGPLGLNIDFVDAVNGWAIDFKSGASSQILHTSDGAESWTSQTSNITIGTEKTPELHDLAMMTATQGVIVGSAFADPSQSLEAQPLILTTTSGGATWSAATLALSPVRPATLTAVCLKPDGIGIAAGSSAVSGATVLKTVDGGQTWSDITANVRIDTADLANPSAVACTGDGTLWLGGSRLRLGILGPTVLLSSDGGLTWEDRSPTLGSELNESAIRISFPSATVGSAILVGTGVVLHTENGGRTWAQQEIPNNVTGLFSSIEMINAGEGAIVGARAAVAGQPPLALVLTTDNGGQSWTTAAVAPSDTLALDDLSIVP